MGSEPNLAGLVTSLTPSLKPNVKSIEIKLGLWRRVEFSCLALIRRTPLARLSPVGLPVIVFVFFIINLPFLVNKVS